MIHLHRIEACRIVIQKSRCAELRRIEFRSPARIRPARCARVDLAHEPFILIFRCGECEVAHDRTAPASDSAWYKGAAFMSKLSVRCFSISLDGYGAGPNQDLANPVGVGGKALHEWIFGTRTFRQMIGQEGGATGIDDDFVARGFENVGAWIIGRNMFGPIRGPWPNEEWK